MISQQTIDQIMAKALVDEVVEEFVNLKPRGVNKIGLCPFHNEKTPSFTVSPSKNIFKCFGCGRGGNSVQFLMEHEHMTYPEALRYLAKKYHIEIEETQTTEEYDEAKLLKESLFIINDYATKYFIEKLWKSEEGKTIGLSYFKERGFLESTIQQFELGYANKEGGFTSEAVKKGYNQEHLQSLGLTTGHKRDFFWERVIFPLHNLSGKVIGFAGRIMGENKKAPKYINSPESEIYSKRHNLYALHLAKNVIRKEDECILVEGYTDVISLHQAGIKNVVASSGTSLTVEQIMLIKRFTQQVLLLFDGDPAGLRAALRGLDLLLEQDVNIRLVALPLGEDPDSWLKKQGQARFLAYLKEHAKDFILFKLELLATESKNDPVKRTEMIKDIVESLAKIPNSIKRSVYIQQSAQVLNISEEILNLETNKAIRVHLLNRRKQFTREKNRAERAALDVQTQKGQKQTQTESLTQNKNHPDEYQERDLIRVLISYGNKWFDEAKDVTIANYVIENIQDIMHYVDNPLYRQIFELISAVIDNKKPIPSLSFFTNHREPEIQKLAIDLTTHDYSYSENWLNKWEISLQTQKMPDLNYIKDCYQSVLHFKKRKINRLCLLNAQRIKDAKDPEKIKIYLKVAQELKVILKDVTDKLNMVILQ